MFQRPTDVMVKSITDYTEIEFLELLKIIISAEGKVLMDTKMNYLKTLSLQQSIQMVLT